MTNGGAWWRGSEKEDGGCAGSRTPLQRSVSATESRLCSKLCSNLCGASVSPLSTMRSSQRARQRAQCRLVSLHEEMGAQSDAEGGQARRQLEPSHGGLCGAVQGRAARGAVLCALQQSPGRQGTFQPHNMPPRSLTGQGRAAETLHRSAPQCPPRTCGGSRRRPCEALHRPLRYIHAVLLASNTCFLPLPPARMNHRGARDH